MIAAIASAFGGVLGAPGEAGQIYNSINDAFTSGGAALGGTSSTILPGAYLAYLVMDVNKNFTGQGGFFRVTTAGNLAKEKISSPTLTMEHPGYIYVFLYNRSNSANWVYFDDLKVTHQRSPIVAGADFYPFGLPMEGREITQEDYRWGYQGQYAEKDTVTGWNQFQLRMYDARFGRWLSVDPYHQFVSPYNGMGNFPISSVDKDGGYVYVIGSRKGFLARLLNFMFNTVKGRSMLNDYIDDPYRHVYVTLGEVTRVNEGNRAVAIHLQSGVAGTPDTRVFNLGESPDLIDFRNAFNGKNIPNIDDVDYWHSTEFNFIVIDDSQIGESNIFGLLDALGHEFAHNYGGDEIHENPNIWGTKSQQDQSNLDKRTFAGQYGDQVLQAIKNGTINNPVLFMQSYTAGRILSMAVLHGQMLRSFKPLVVPVNRVLKKVVPTIR